MTKDCFECYQVILSIVNLQNKKLSLFQFFVFEPQNVLNLFSFFTNFSHVLCAAICFLASKFSKFILIFLPIFQPRSLCIRGISNVNCFVHLYREILPGLQHFRDYTCDFFVMTEGNILRSDQRNNQYCFYQLTEETKKI